MYLLSDEKDETCYQHSALGLNPSLEAGNRVHYHSTMQLRYLYETLHLYTEIVTYFCGHDNHICYLYIYIYTTLSKDNLQIYTIYAYYNI